MDFSHYTDRPVVMAMDLVNTERPAEAGDDLSGLDDLLEFAQRYRELWEGDVRAPQPSDLPQIRTVRTRLRSVFTADSPDSAIGEINRLLSDHTATPRVSTHGGTPHMHFEPHGSAFGPWVAVVTAMALATVLVEHGVDRFGECASSTCTDVFIDTSRNRSRRHCSTTCATRENVAAYRRRRRNSDA